MPFVPKARLGTYEIVGPLGAGGMGEVYRAKDLRLGRDVAVKVLPAEVASSPERLAQFEREARTVAGLNHPNIVTLFSVEDEDGVRFLTMELVEGPTLSSLVVAGGLPLSRVLDLSIPLADALVAAHERGVIHRDLKPGNVMVARDGRVKMLDFGLATEARGSANPQGATVTAETGAMFGTIPYMAPEQLRGEPADARTDLFALGMIVYELVAGRRPFANGATAEVMSSILRDKPEPLADLRSDVPDDLERIVSLCLEKDRRRRAQSALEVRNALRGVMDGLGQTAPSSKKPRTREGISIAVLPFVNRSRSEDDEYFSDGLADELIGTLAKIGGLRVAARTSAFHFKGKDTTIAQVGSALNVATVLDGSVRKAGNRVRISVQLVKVSDGYHLWSETYDRTLDDIFAVQDDIAQSVVKELRAALLGKEPDSGASLQAKAEVARAARGRGTNPEAHRLYLLARHLIDRGAPEEAAKATEYLKEALALDPEFAVAWAELSRSYAGAAGQGWIPVNEGYDKARDAAERALAIEPDLAEGHAEIGWIRMTHDWDWQGAEVSFARALELAPGSTLVTRRIGVLVRTLGRLEEAIGHYRRTLEQDPLNAVTYHNLGSALHAEGRFAEADASYRSSLELAPTRFCTRAYLALNLLAMDRREEALAEAMEEPDEGFRLWALAIVHRATGRRDEAEAALRGLVEKHAEDSPYQIAEVHGAWGEADASFEWLERAYALRDGGLTETMISSRLRSLHDDPRWGLFLRKMRLKK